MTNVLEFLSLLNGNQGGTKTRGAKINMNSHEFRSLFFQSVNSFSAFTQSQQTISQLSPFAKRASLLTQLGKQPTITQTNEQIFSPNSKSKSVENIALENQPLFLNESIIATVTNQVSVPSFDNQNTEIQKTDVVDIKNSSNQVSLSQEIGVITKLDATTDIKNTQDLSVGNQVSNDNVNIESKVSSKENRIIFSSIQKESIQNQINKTEVNNIGLSSIHPKQSEVISNVPLENLNIQKQLKEVVSLVEASTGKIDNFSNANTIEKRNLVSESNIENKPNSPVVIDNNQFEFVTNENIGVNNNIEQKKCFSNTDTRILCTK